MISREEKLIESEIRKLVPVLGKGNAIRLTKAYLLGDEDTKKRIFEMVDAIKAAVFSNEEMRDTLLMEPPPKRVALEGDIEIGNVLYGRKKTYPMRIRKESLLTHMGIFGSSGYGKTNISFCMIKQLSDSGVPVIIFDFSKRNYKDLLSTDLKDRIELFTVGRNVAPLRFNPLRPPNGIQLSQWMKEFSSIFDHAYWLLGGGRHIIMKAMDSVYGDVDNPRMKHLKSWLVDYASSKSMPARERNWIATAERPLESLCFKELGQVFDCDKGITPSDFFRPGKITILELESLDNNDKTFLIEIMLQWIRDWLVMEGKKEELIGTVVLEEAHHILNREKSKRLGSETVMDLIFREVRELGLGVIYIDQHPSLVSYPAMGNTSTHIYMNLGLDTKQSSDIVDASNMLGLDYEEQGGYIRKLPVGHGFMLCRNSEFPNSFLVGFSKFNMKKGVIRDDDIRELMREKIVKEIREEEPEEQKPAPKEPKRPRERPEDVPMDSIQEINENEWSIIKVIGEGFGVFSSQIYKNLSISGSAFNKRIEKLIDLDLVEMRKAKARKNRLNYYYLTELGMDVFATRYGIGEEVHEIRIDKILEMFKLAGWPHEVRGDTVELTIGGKKANIILERSQDREKIYSDLGRNRYFICATEQIKNIVLQEAARRASGGKKFAVFISTVKGFEENGEFERIEFD
jgi:DNA-binding MarR family transcriptional regulator